MRLYGYYIKLLFQQIKTNKLRALKTIPGVSLFIFAIIFIIFNLVVMSPKHSMPHSTLYEVDMDKILLEINRLKMFGIGALVIGLPILFFLRKDIGFLFRQSDVDTLMPAPISTFQTFIFVQLRTLIMQFSGVLLLLGIQLPSILVSVKYNYFIVFAYFIEFIMLEIIIILLLYYVRYLKFKYNKIVRATIIAIILISLCTFGPLMVTGQDWMSNTWLQLVPVFGWILAFTNLMFTQNYVAISLLGIILAIIIVVMYKKLNKFSYDYYEDELKFVAKTEKQLARMESKKTSDSEWKIFKKSKASFKHLGSKVLIDLAFIRSGKFWMLAFERIFELAICAIFLFSFSLANTNSEAVWQALVIMIGLRAYMGILTGLQGDDVFQDFYLHLLPIKTIPKLIYFNIKYIITDMLYTIISWILVVIFFKNSAFIDKIYILIILLVVSFFETIRAKIIMKYIFLKIGRMLMMLISLLFMVVEVATFAGTIFALLYLKVPTFVIFLIVLTIALIITGIFIFVSKLLYEKAGYFISETA